MKWLITIIILSISAICLYFIKFGGGLSTAQSDWASFGSYLAGVAAVVNIAVFIALTITIQNAGDKQREKDKKHQKNLILTQLREAELSTLSKILNDATDLTLNEFQHFRIIRANRCLQTFNGSRSNLFPIIKTEDVQNTILNLITTMNKIQKELIRISGLNDAGIPVSPPLPVDTTLFKTLITDFDTLKYSFISQLEQFTLDQIDK